MHDCGNVEVDEAGLVDGRELGARRVKYRRELFDLTEATSDDVSVVARLREIDHGAVNLRVGFTESSSGKIV